MNIVMIMSGGVGSRFGANTPKQYNLIAGRPVIDYVIDAVLESKQTDKVVVVIDPQWIGYSGRLKDAGFDFADNGNTRLESVQNGLNLISAKYSCEKLVIVDAVAPFLTGKIVDQYFELLDSNDAVITAQKITGGFTDIYNNQLDREKYIITQSPEGFNFSLFLKHFSVDYPYQEMAGMLPENAKRYYNYEFRNNLKLTYDYELGYAESVLAANGRINKTSEVSFDRSILCTKGIQSFLLRNEKEKTERWLDKVYDCMPELIDKWKLTHFLPNQVSRFGLVLQAKSSIYGEVILKFIPDFIGRYARECEAMRLLPSSYMCRVIERDDRYNVLLLEKISPASYASFEDNKRLLNFFACVMGDIVEYKEEMSIKFIPDYFEELSEKLENINLVPYCKDQVEKELKDAIELYKKYFFDSKKYIVHGDLHEQNILRDKDGYKGIDPNGMIAPREMELVRFIRNDLRNHAEFGYSERMQILLGSFERFAKADSLLLMFIIDMAFCTYNSTFENEKDDETRVDLELIRVAKELYEKNFGELFERN